MRKKTIKYTIVDLGGTRYVVLRLASITVGPTEADQPDSTSNQ